MAATAACSVFTDKMKQGGRAGALGTPPARGFLNSLKPSDCAYFSLHHSSPAPPPTSTPAQHLLLSRIILPEPIPSLLKYLSGESHKEPASAPLPPNPVPTPTPPPSPLHGQTPQKPGLCRLACLLAPQSLSNPPPPNRLGSSCSCWAGPSEGPIPSFPTGLLAFFRAHRPLLSGAPVLDLPPYWSVGVGTPRALSVVLMPPHRDTHSRVILSPCGFENHRSYISLAQTPPPPEPRLICPAADSTPFPRGPKRHLKPNTPSAKL